MSAKSVIICRDMHYTSKKDRRLQDMSYCGDTVEERMDFVNQMAESE